MKTQKKEDSLSPQNRQIERWVELSPAVQKKKNHLCLRVFFTDNSSLFRVWIVTISNSLVERHSRLFFPSLFHGMWHFAHGLHQQTCLAFRANGVLPSHRHGRTSMVVFVATHTALWPRSSSCFLQYVAAYFLLIFCFRSRSGRRPPLFTNWPCLRRFKSYGNYMISWWAAYEILVQVSSGPMGHLINTWNADSTLARWYRCEVVSIYLSSENKSPLYSPYSAFIPESSHQPIQNPYFSSNSTVWATVRHVVPSLKPLEVVLDQRITPDDTLYI